MTLLELYDQLINIDFSDIAEEDNFNFKFTFEGNYITAATNLEDVGDINVVITEDESGYTEFNVKATTEGGKYEFDIGEWVQDIYDEDNEAMILDEEDYGQYFFEKLESELFI